MKPMAAQQHGSKRANAGSTAPAPVRVAAAAALLGAFWTGGCGSEAPEEVTPLLVVGIDGLDPVILGELIEAGRVPTFQRFVDEGSLGRLQTMVPTFSPVIWTTIATGQPPEAHGVLDFLDASVADAENDHKGLPFTSNAREVPAIWNLVSDAGRSVDCTGWWVTWPAENINGRMVASYAAQAQAEILWKPTLWDDLEEMTWPAALASEIKEHLLLADGIEQVLPHVRTSFPIPEQLDAQAGRILTDLAWTFAADLSVAQVTRHLLETGQADLTMAYLATPDVAGHRFWRYHAPGDMNYPVPEKLVRAYEDYIALSYVAADRMLGELIAQASDDTTVLVLSDHGMHVDPYNVDKPLALNSGAHEDAPDGVVGMLGPRAAALGDRLGAGRALGHVGEVAPLVLQLQGVPVPRDWPAATTQRRALENLLDEDWRAAHPLVVGDGMQDFRPATPSRVPAVGMNQKFILNMQDLGYLGGTDAQEGAEPGTGDAARAESDPASEDETDA